MIKAPKGLDPDAREFWETMTRDFVFDVHELMILEAATRCLDEANRADAEIIAEGRMIGISRGARRVHPLLKHARDSRLAAAHLIDKLRLDRAKLAPQPLVRMPNRRMISAGGRG